jgi:hypothetical protein
MPGFLDPNAVSVEAEYTRYLDADVLGKIVLKNFAINVLGLDARDIRIPVSRHGDVGNYKDFCNAGIRIHGRLIALKLSARVTSSPKKRVSSVRLRAGISESSYILQEADDSEPTMNFSSQLASIVLVWRTRKDTGDISMRCARSISKRAVPLTSRCGHTTPPF